MIAGLVVLLLSSTGAPPGANPSMIDPMDPAAGDFLDIDLGMYRELGMASYAEGSYPMAARYFLAFLTRNATDSGVIYNLACCYGLLDEPALAALYLTRAVQAGFSDLELAREDPDFSSVRDSPEFETVMGWMERTVAPPGYLGERLIIECATTLPCLYRLPEGYDGSTAVPLVIGLHGYGDTPENFIRLWNLFDSPGFLFACPRAPYAAPLAGTYGWSWFMTSPDSGETARFDRYPVDLVMASIDSLRARFHISGVFLVGFSQGCALTWLTGLEEPGELDGIVGLGGRIDTTRIPDSLYVMASDLPAFVGNGTLDEQASPLDGEAAAGFLSEHGFTVTLRTWEGGHAIDRTVLLEVQRWIEGITAVTPTDPPLTGRTAD